MIHLNDLPDTELQKIRMACAYLFRPGLAGNNRFLEKLDAESVKNAFQEKEKRYNPDLHPDESHAMINKRKERWAKIRQSYEALKLHIRDEQKCKSAAKQGRIIAVGGAKGGTGKSIFAANLGVLLSAAGRRTVLVDMDLGGANLHLYLGETSLRHTLHDFLAKASPSLKAIMSPTQYGPYLIGGDSGQLGAANIPFARKLKFLKAIRNLEADDVILDLGGDTSYNVLDFFLAADHQLVFTTCDPASYLDAYSFIKTALYRKLVRMFGPESPYRHQKNAELAMIIRDFTSPKRSTRAKSVRELMQEVNQDHPHLFSPLQMAVRSFAPQIVMSMMDGESTAKKVFGRIQDVSQKMLGIQVGYLGNISYQPEIKHSAQSLVPVVARNPKGIFAECIRKILAGLQAQL